MELCVGDIMKQEPRVVAPDLALPELERAFIEQRVGGFPVVQRGELVGIVSRSDIVRQLCVEGSLAENVSDYYHNVAGPAADPGRTFEEIAQSVGRRIEHLRVRDVMVRQLITAQREQSLVELAELMCRRRIHRVPVTEDGRLVGIVSALDFVHLFAERRVRTV